MKRAKLRQLGTAAVSAAALLGMAALMPGEAFAQKTITVIIPEEPNALDNCDTGRSAVGRVLRQNVNESLIELDPNDGKLTPRLVTDWKQLDPNTWQFTLRQGVKYSDGTPLTAEAVKDTFAKMVDPAIDCNSRTKQLAGMKLEFTPLDGGKFNIRTETPEPILPIRLSTVTIGYPGEPRKMINSSIGTGPYVLDEWKQGVEIVLKRNPNYWGKAPVLDGATFIWRKESAVAAAMVEVGEAQIATNISQQDASNPVTDVAYPDSETNYLRIESQVPPLDDLRIRQAINHAIDREALHGTIIPKQAMIATQMVIPRINGHNHKLDKERFTYDPEMSKKLIAAAKADGVKVDTEIQMIGRINQWANTTETMEAIYAMLTEVGLNVKLKMVEVGQWNDYNAHPNKGANTPDSEAKVRGRAPVLLGHMHDNNIGDPVFSMFPKYGCKAPSSTHCWPKLEAQILKAQGTPAGEERIKLWQEAFRMIHEDYAADAFLFHMVSFARVSPKINYTPTAATNSEVLLEQITFK